MDVENRLSPPHSSAFFRSEVFKQVGLYKTNFKIAGDFDYFIRCFLKYKLKFSYLNECLVYMSTGGTSGKNILSYLISSKEINFFFEIKQDLLKYISYFIEISIKLIQLFFRQ